MANSVGSVSIDLTANIAKFQSDMGRAARVADQQAAAIKKSLMGIAGALGAVVSVAGIAAFVKSSLDAQDAISKLSQKVNVSTETLSGWQLAAKQAGVEGDGFQKGMIKLAQSSALANDGSKLQASAFKALGVSFTDATGHLKPMSALLPQVADAFARTKDSTEKTVIATRLFGKAGADLIPMLNAGSKGLSDYMKMADDFGLTVNGKAGKAAERFNDALEQLGFVSKGVANQIASSLAPALADLADKAVSFFRSQDWKNVLADISTGAKYVADHIGDIIAAVKLLGQVVTTVYAGKLIYSGSLWIANLASQTTAVKGLIVAQSQWGAATAGSFKAAYANIGALGIALNLVGAAVVGWQIGKYLSDQFVEVRLAGVALVDGLLTAWERVKEGALIAWAAVGAGWELMVAGIKMQAKEVIGVIATILHGQGNETAATALDIYAARISTTTDAISKFKTTSDTIHATADKNIAAIHKTTDEMVDYEIAQEAAKRATVAHTVVLKDNSAELALAAAAAQAAAEAMAKLYASTVKAFQDRIAVDRKTLDNGKALSEAEKARVKLLQDMSNGTLKVTDAQRAFLLSIADTDVKLQKDIALQKDKAAGMAAIASQAEALNAALQNQKDQNSIDQIAVGHGSQITKQLQDELRIRQEYQKKLQDINKEANRAENVGGTKGVGGEAYNTMIANAKKSQDAVTAEYRKGIEDRQKLEANGMNGLHAAVDDYTATAKNVASQTQTLFSNAFSGMTDALTSFVTTGKGNFADLAKSIIADLVKIEIRILLSQALSSIFGGFASSYNSMSSSQQVAYDVAHNANGGVYSSPSLSQYSGQIVSNPTTFAFAKGAGVMGEAGPEAILPLSRGSDGKLGVKSGGGVGDMQVVINITNNGQQVQARQTGSSMDGKKMMIDLILDTVSGDMVGGGKTARAAQQRFGLQRRGVPVSG